jgi:hypothetical protein
VSSFLARRIKRNGLSIGTAQAVPGQIVYGTFEGVALPTGGTDDFPVIVVRGKHDGPTLWITASIHGNEYTGIAVIHDLLNHLTEHNLLSRLRGALVCIPTLNPGGLRIGERRSYHARNQDPNRLFPASGKAQPPKSALPSDPEPPSALEMTYARLFEVISQSADYLIDLHNYSLHSLPFAFRDPVGYSDEKDKAEARQLQQTMDSMLAAFGHTIINEYATADYLKRNLHRSVSGAVLNAARIPSFTVELGGYLSVDPVIVSAASAGIRNVMRWASMLDNGAEPITGIKVLTPGYPIRRIQHPHAPDSGIAHFLVKSGDPVKKGDRIARLSDMWGRPIGPDGGAILSGLDGFVLGVMQGALFYHNDPVLSMAIRDDSELLVQFTPAS